MGNYRARRYLVTQRPHNGLAGETVKAIALKTSLEKLVSEWKACRELGNGAMERRIEAGDVSHIGKGTDGAVQNTKCRRQVEWSETDRVFELGQHFRRNPLMFPKSPA